MGSPGGATGAGVGTATLSFSDVNRATFNYIVNGTQQTKSLTRQVRVEEPLTQAKEIYRLACFLLARDRLVSGPLRLIGIGVSTLAPPSPQLRLPL